MSTGTTNRSVQGNLLVATPFIDVPPYRHAVVLVISHSERGAVGLVLDNNLGSELAELKQYLPGLAQNGGRLTSTAPDLKPFVGAVCWGPNQLDREIDHGIWLGATNQLKAIEVGADLWVSLLRQIGRSVLIDSLNLRHFPADPRWN